MTTPDDGSDQPAAAELAQAGHALQTRLRQALAATDAGDGELDDAAATATRAALAEADAFLAELGDATLPDGLGAELEVTRALLLGRLGRVDAAIAQLTAVADQAASSEPAAVQTRGYALLSSVNLLAAAGRIDEAAAAVQRLLTLFEAQPPDEIQTGLGAMLLDTCLWWVVDDRPLVALELCMALVQRLTDGGSSARMTVAGARFYAAQAAGQLGQMELARDQITALCAAGEPALAALDRIAAQFGGAEVNPAWHAQIAAATVTVLWQMGRLAEARALAEHASRRFAALGLPTLEKMLADLAQEITPA